MIFRGGHIRFLGWVLGFISAINAHGQEVYRVQPLPINSPEKNEFCILPFDGRLIFCSDRIDYSALKYETAKDGKPLVNLFMTQTDSTVNAEAYSTFNSIYHDGPIVFYDENTKAVLTRNISQESKLKSQYKDTKLGLFFYEKVNGEWEMKSEFPFNNYKFSCGHAAIDESGSVLIFSSDMPGGYGKTDLYYSLYKDSTWTLPKNMGPIINSKGNEMFPFLHGSGTLFYSSSGKDGKGGLDVFHTIGGFPYSRIVRESDDINTEQDDFGFWATPDLSSGYLSSNRNGTDDLFSIHLETPEFGDCETYEPVSFCYEFYEMASIDIDTIPLVYEWDFGDGYRQKGLIANHCYAQPGDYVIQLNVFDTVINTLYMNEATYEISIADVAQPEMRMPDTVGVNQEFMVKAGQGRFTDFQISEYYWYFDDGRKPKGVQFPWKMEAPGTYQVRMGVASAPNAQGESQKKCYYRTLVVVEEEQMLADYADEKDPLMQLPGDNEALAYVITQDQKGIHLYRMEEEQSEKPGLKKLPSGIYYLDELLNGDTVVLADDVTAQRRKYLDDMLTQLMDKLEKDYQGIYTTSGTLPHDSLLYPEMSQAIYDYYRDLTEMTRKFNEQRPLPEIILLALQQQQAGEAELNANQIPSIKDYDALRTTGITNDSTTVFYRQSTTDSSQSNANQTVQYDTKQWDPNNGQNNQQQNTTQAVDTTQNVTQNNQQQNTTQPVDTTQNIAQNNQQQNTTQPVDTTQNITQNNQQQNTTQPADTTQNITQNNQQQNTTQLVDTAQNVTQNNQQQNNTQPVDTTQNITQNNQQQNNTQPVDTAQNVTQNNQQLNNTQPVDTTQNITQNNQQQNNTQPVDTAQNVTQNNQQLNNTQPVDTTQNITQNNQQQNNTQPVDTAQNVTQNNQQQNNTQPVDTTQNITQNNQQQNNTQPVDTTQNITQNNQQQNTTQPVDTAQNITQNNQQQNTTQPVDTTQNITQNNQQQNNSQLGSDTLTKSSLVDTLELTLREMLPFAHPDLIYRVQIGAYRFPKNFKYEKYLQLGKKDEVERLPDGITRFTLGRFNTLQEAYAFKDRVKVEGIDDAFVTAIFQQKRFYLSDLKAILKPLIRQTL